MRLLHSIAFAYEAKEDRLLAAINAGRPDAWSCWLTRRLVLAMLGQVPGLLERSSGATQQAPIEFRSDMIAFEKEASMAQTAQAMTTTGSAVLQASARSAELAERVTITAHGDKFQFEVHGGAGGAAAGLFERPYLQRLLQMLQEEAVRAQWLVGVAATEPSTGSSAQDSGPKRVRH